MAKMSTHDRARLIKALQEGGLSVVTHRYREEVPGGVEECRVLTRLCEAGLLRLDRISGDKYNPAGERRYEYKLTTKGQREAK